MEKTFYVLMTEEVRYLVKVEAESGDIASEMVVDGNGEIIDEDREIMRVEVWEREG